MRTCPRRTRGGYGCSRNAETASSGQPSTKGGPGMTTLPAPAALSLDSARVEDVMHPGVFTCLFETPLAEVARMMAAHQVHCVVGFGDATEGDTRLWGIVSDRDVVAAAATDYAHRTAGTSATTPT